MSPDIPLHPEEGLAPSESDARWAEAAAHLARRDRGATTEEAEAFARWLSGDGARREAVDQLDRVWTALDALREHNAPGHGSAADAVYEPARRRRPAILRPLFRPWLAAAASLALLLGGAGLLRVWPERPEVFATAVGAASSSLLADGTRARLNTDSEIEVVLGRHERHVRLLRGEACFEVSHDSRRPFTVEVGGVRVRVLGTVFNLRKHDGGAELVVAEGRVRVDTDSDTVRAGEHATVAAGWRAALSPGLPENAGGVRIEKLDADALGRALAWREGRIVFSATPLPEALAELARHHPVRLEIADRELDGVLLGGAFEAADLDGFLQLLEAGFGVRVERMAADHVRLHRAAR